MTTTPLDTIDRFFRIITSSDDKNNQRLMQQWDYLHTLLKSQPVSYDRIQAYLSILENHDYNTRKNVNKVKKSLTDHPKAKQLLDAVDQIADVLDKSITQIRSYQKYD